MSHVELIQLIQECELVDCKLDLDQTKLGPEPDRRYPWLLSMAQGPEDICLVIRLKRFAKETT